MDEKQIEATRKLLTEKGVIAPGAADKGSERPEMSLPGENREIGVFCNALGDLLKDAPIFLRRSEVMVLDAGQQRFALLTAKAFVTWVEAYIAFVKKRKKRISSVYARLKSSLRPRT